MDKVDITIDLLKIDKSRIEERTYTNKEGVEVKVKDYKITAVPLKEDQQSVLAEGTGKDGNKWEMIKSHFVVNSPTKEERESQAKTGTLGSGVTFKFDGDTTAPATKADPANDQPW